MPLGKHITGTPKFFTYSTISNVGLYIYLSKFCSTSPAQLSNICIMLAPALI